MSDARARDELRGRRAGRRAAAPASGRSRATRSTPRCWSSCSSTSPSPAATRRSGCWSISSTDHMGLSAGADVREELDEEGQVAPHAALRRPLRRRSSPSRSRRSRPATATSSAAAPRSRSPATCGSAAPTCGCASPAPRWACRSARPAWSPSAASPPPSTCCSPRAPSAPTRRCGSASSTASPPPRATEEAALELAAEVAAHPPEAVARLKRMLHEWDDVEGRSAAEGEGQVEWQRTGPGLPFTS